MISPESFTLENENATERAQAIRYITTVEGEKKPFDYLSFEKTILESCESFPDVDRNLIIEETLKNLYEEIPEEKLMTAAIMASRPFIERDPSYGYVTAAFLLQKLFTEVLGKAVHKSDRKKEYMAYLPKYLELGIAEKRLNPKLLTEFNLEKIQEALCPDRDEKFNFLGLQTLYDRYFIHVNDRRIELPQVFWMRVAMGLALVEATQEIRTEKAIAFYTMLSNFDYVSSTPTLFNAGTTYPQLSSCFLTTIPDDLGDIYKSYRDNALLSKFSGGLGNDWTPVRGLGSRIKGTNGISQGIIPFLKVANDTAIAVNQGGKRKGAVCSYLETWHIDVEEYLDLRKNTGDDRRRCHDMNTANWIPDLFMKRVHEKGAWTLFSPEETPDLHDLCGKAFEERYAQYEVDAENGKIINFKKVEAVNIWRKMLSMLFETGHPWITFKDPSNLRSPQQHAGVVHSSNLCTEILLNTSSTETAVCNLGSINLVQHTDENGNLMEEKIKETVSVAMRMLDNVIDQNYYPIPEAKNSNTKHRPVGMGIMGFQDTLYKRRASYASDAAVSFADESMEMISYYAILASTELAGEKGAYESYKGSLWDQGILPVESQKLVEESRGNSDYIEADYSAKKDWAPVKEAIKKNGMRNSNCMAIAPTATISNIAGVSQSIEPMYKNLFVKSNMSGEFTIINPYLVTDLKKLNLWNDEMIYALKRYDGNLTEIQSIPQELKELYQTAFEVGAKWLIDAASRRQKWIDMGQSLNLYIAQPNGKKLDEMYKYAWKKGLKTTYYLRSMGASSVEKSTITTNEHTKVSAQVNACSIEDPECEACQ